MKTHVLKINANNLHRQIHEDYFKYRDIFYRCLVGNLALHQQLYTDVLSSSVMEDAMYNQYLLSLINTNITVESILRDIDSPHNLSIFLDTSTYFEEFILYYHNSKFLNVYQLTIDDTCNIVVTNKHLRVKRHA